MEFVVTRSDELQHHGTKGMKWGQRLYQTKDGSLTPLGRVRYSTNKDFKKQVDRKKALEKARQAKAEKKQHEDDKQRVIKSGSAQELLKYKGELTNQEMNNAWQRIQWEQNMKNVVDRETQNTGKSRADKAIETLGKATLAAETVIKAYNTVANVNNAFNTGTLLPKIETNVTNGNRKEYKADKKEKQKAKDAEKKREEQEAQAESKRQERAEKRAAEENNKQQSNQTSKQKESKKESKSYDDGKIYGEGTSTSNLKREMDEGKKWWDTSDVYETVDYTYESSGQRYVALLEDKTKR